MDVAFSVIVPMRNEQAYVGETIRSLMSQDYPRAQVEILVVDGRSTDGSRDVVTGLAAEHPNIRLLDNPRLISAAARNIGVRAARGRFIAIVDCHSFVDPDFLRTAAHVFQDTGADCLGRPVELFIPTDSYLQRVIGAARTSWLGHNPVSGRYSRERGATSPLSVAIVYRRAVFDRVGLFDEEFGACEDVEFNFRVQQAGMRTWTDPALRCYYHPRPSLSALFQQLRRYAYWRYRLLRAQRRAFHASQAAPAAAVVLGAALVVGAALHRVPALAPLALVAAYAALLGIASLQAARRRGLRYLPLLPLAFLVIHLGAAVGLWAGVLDDARRGVARVARALRLRARDVAAAAEPPGARARRAGEKTTDSWVRGYLRGRTAGKGLAASGLRVRTAAALDALRAYFPGDQEIRLLDIGTADGEMLVALGNELRNLKAVGLDTSFELLTAGHAPVTMVRASAVRLAFEDDSFDACLMAAVLKHVRQADLALAEAARVVKPGGAVIVIEPSPVAIRAACLVGYLEKSSLAHRFSVGALRRMARGAGLELVGLRFVVVHTRWRWLNSLVNGALRWSRLSVLAPAWMVLVFKPQPKADSVRPLSPPGGA